MTEVGLETVLDMDDTIEFEDIMNLEAWIISVHYLLRLEKSPPVLTLTTCSHASMVQQYLHRIQYDTISCTAHRIELQSTTCSHHNLLEGKFCYVPLHWSEQACGCCTSDQKL